MSVEKISIETFRDEIKDKRVRLTLDSDNINNTMSPIKCDLNFESINVNVIHPASVHLFGESGRIRLSQINCIHKEIKYETTLYILNCGKLAQTGKDYVLTVL